MRTIMILLVLVVAFCAPSQAQKLKADQVPAAVTNAFKSKYPAIEKVKWEIEDEVNYEGEFKLDGKETSVKFDKSGNWLETETEMKVADLPKAVKDGLNKSFAGYKVLEAEHVEVPDNKTFYEVKIERGPEQMDVKVSSAGEIIDKEVEKDDDED